MRRLAATLCAFAALGGATLDGALAIADDRTLVDDVRFGVDASRTRIVIESDRPLSDHQVFTLAEQGARVVVDLEAVQFDLGGQSIGGGQSTASGQGLVAGYRYAGDSGSRSRVVFDLAEPAAIAGNVQLDPAPGSNRYRLVVDLEPTSAASFQARAGHPQGSTESPAAAAPAPSDGASSSPTMVVVLDPGHGGRDRGARGVEGALEKSVNLELALDIRERLEATGRYRVVMTRDDDHFVELEDRVRIARDAGADLFLSIHADAGHHASTRGASVYTLAERAEGRSRTEILEEDPRILDVDLTTRRAEVGDILVDLVQSDTKNQSSAFAEILIPHLDEAGPLLRNTHRSDNFYVLLAPDVPAVLLEAGFITNSEDEFRLTSSQDRGVLADAIVAGVQEYFAQRERLYAAR